MFAARNRIIIIPPVRAYFLPDLSPVKNSKPRRKPLGNKKVQEALRYLVDYDGMANSFLKDKVTVLQTVWPYGSWGALTKNPYKLDIQKAKSLLKEAGFEDGFSATFHTLSDSPYPEIAQTRGSFF